MPRTFFVVGPISVGKNAFALDWAERESGEIVNADAFQVYDGLEKLTSRPTPADCWRVPHHLFGFVPLKESFNVAQYVARARRCLEEIHQRGRTAVVVGGTGLYVKALTHGLSTLPPSDPALRARLEAMSLEELSGELLALDPVGFAAIDLKNKRRLVRALEVCAITSKPFSAHREAWDQSAYRPEEAGVFLDRERDSLRARIDAQVDRIFQEGVVDEIRTLSLDAVGATAAGAIGLGEIRSFLAGQISLHDCMNQVKTRTKQYAKRQITWFEREQVFQRMVLPPGDGH